MPAPIEVSKRVIYCLKPGCNIILTIPGQLRCSEHAHEYRRERNTANKKARRAAKKIIGVTSIPCKLCGVQVVRTCATKKYCDACAVLSVKQKQKERDAKKIRVPNKYIVAGTVINLSYPHNTAKAEREVLRMDALVRAARLPGYDPHCPERYIVEVVT
jgi:hypothetical protein